MAEFYSASDIHIIRAQGQRTINSKDSYVFWTGLYAMVGYIAYNSLMMSPFNFHSLSFGSCWDCWQSSGFTLVCTLGSNELYTHHPHACSQPEYALVVVLAIVLSGANLIGYIKCSKDAQKQMQNLASNALTTGITVRGHAGDVPTGIYPSIFRRRFETGLARRCRHGVDGDHVRRHIFF